MAVRMRLRHQEDIRAKIQAAKLIDRIQQHVDGKLELSATQLKGAEILLRKSLADLTAVTISGEDGGPVQTTVEVILRAAAKDQG